jgi:thiaminase/transcriptional activator TenA
MTSNMSFSDDLTQSNDIVWKKILNNSFVAELTKNTLPRSKLIFYLNQDKLFLMVFYNLLSKTLTIQLEKEQEVLIESIIQGVRQELRMQNEILHELGGTGISIVADTHSIAHDYVSYLTRLCYSKDIHLIFSAIAPCPWTYYEISNNLIASNIKSHIVRRWLEFYSSKESATQVNQIKKILNSLSSNVDDMKRKKMKYFFSTSCNYELQFWHLAYHN